MPRVYLCFAYTDISKKFIISLNSINCLIFANDTDCVYCTAQTEYLNKIKNNFSPLKC
jgi:hypothetical protein